MCIYIHTHKHMPFKRYKYIYLATATRTQMSAIECKYLCMFTRTIYKSLKNRHAIRCNTYIYSCVYTHSKTNNNISIKTKTESVIYT